MKNYGDLGGCYPPTLLDLHNSSEDIQPHSLIVSYSISLGGGRGRGVGSGWALIRGGR